MAYASMITRDYLKFLGITEVTEDGRIFNKNGEITQHSKNNYKDITVYDPYVRDLIPVERRSNHTGEFTLGVHIIVYTWFCKDGIKPAGWVVDHINNIKDDNRVENLQLKTPGGNIWKEREKSTKEIKCRVNVPRSHYENKLKKYQEKYNEAILAGNQKEAKKQRGNIYQNEGRLRYWDSYHKLEEMAEYFKEGD